MKMIDTFRFLLLTLVIFAIAGVVQAQTVTFAQPLFYGTGVQPYDITSGDFSGDGKPDIVTANVSNNTFSIFVNNGNGTFQTASHYAVGPVPTSVAAGNFDSDGNLDLVVAEFGHPIIRLFRGNGDGTFQPGVAYFTIREPLVVITTDLNNDNKLDLVTANYNASGIAVLLGNGDGTFQNAVQFGGGGTESGLVAADFNQDGNTDIAATTKFRPYGIVVLFGNGDGTLGPAAQYNANDHPEGIAAGNFDGDNYPDLVVGNTGNGNRASVLLNNGDGTFQPPVSYSTLSLLTPDVAVTDIDLDGRLDIVASQNGQPTYIAVFLGNGNGTFQSAVNIPFSGNSENPATITIADFNGDSRPDVATANRSTSTIAVLLNTTTPADPMPPTTTILSTPDANAEGWHNSDIDLSLTATDNPNGSGVSHITYSATGAHSIPQTVASGSSANLSITTEGVTTITYFASDNVGNPEAPQTLVVRIDKTPPGIVLTTPAAGSVFTLNQIVNSNYGCTDGGSGLTSCVGTTANGSAIDTSTQGTKNFTVIATDAAGNINSAQNTYTIVLPQLTALGPAQVWIGLKNSDDVGIRFDLRAEVYRGETLVGSGELSSVHGGSSGFNNAHLHSITMTPLPGMGFMPGDTLTIRLLVRNACTGSGKNSGRARLWYNDSAANSRFDANIGDPATYYLGVGSSLATTPGGGPKATVDVQAGAKCSAYKLFGDWSVGLL